MSGLTSNDQSILLNYIFYNFFILHFLPYLTVLSQNARKSMITEYNLCSVYTRLYSVIIDVNVKLNNNPKWGRPKTLPTKPKNLNL